SVPRRWHLLGRSPARLPSRRLALPQMFARRNPAPLLGRQRRVVNRHSRAEGRSQIGSGGKRALLRTGRKGEVVSTRRRWRGGQAGRPVDRLQFSQRRVLRRRLEILELAGRRQNTGVIGSDRGIVVADRAFQRFPKFAEVARERRKALVKRSSEHRNLAGVLCQRFLPRSIGDGPQQGDESSRGGENDAMIHAPLDQTGIHLQRGGEKRLTGDRKSVV